MIQLQEGRRNESKGQYCLFLIGTKRFKNVKASFVANGLAIREHKNSRRLPHNTLPHECKVHVVKFLQNFAEEHAILSI